jgi:hypothetical protein
MHIVIDLDGVLRGYRNDEPIPQGILITGALSAYNKISFITDLSPNHAQQWINQNKIVDYDNMIDASVGIDGDPLKPRQLKLARAKSVVDLFITSDPALWAVAFDLGIPSLMFGVPGYLRPEFRPDAPKSVRSWDDIAASVAKQNEMMTKDRRIIRTETVRFGD